MEVINASLLIIEDDTYSCNVLQEFLSRYFKVVVSAQNINDALNQYTLSNPDIILSDIELLGENTFELIKKIKQEKPHISIFLLSAYSKEEYFFEAIKLQVEEFIKKPITSSKLNNFVDKCRKKFYITKVSLSQEHKIYYCYKTKILYVNERSISLTNMEISFLELLLRYKNEIVHYNNIENELYSEKGFNKEALRMLTSRIRKKIGIPMILSHSDLGYSIKIDFH